MVGLHNEDVITPTDRPKSVRNSCVIEVLVAFCVVALRFAIFCWCIGYCDTTESDVFPFSRKIMAKDTKNTSRYQNEDTTADRRCIISTKRAIPIELRISTCTYSINFFLFFVFSIKRQTCRIFNIIYVEMGPKAFFTLPFGKINHSFSTDLTAHHLTMCPIFQKNLLDASLARSKLYQTTLLHVPILYHNDVPDGSTYRPITHTKSYDTFLGSNLHMFNQQDHMLNRTIPSAVTYFIRKRWNSLLHSRKQGNIISVNN